MTQKAILEFEDDSGKHFLSGDYQGQATGTHINLNGANDFNGRGATDMCWLLAPYDCKVVSYEGVDNCYGFDSLDKVTTARLGEQPCWFKGSHINTADAQKLGLTIGKTFKQGERCYREGIHGLNSGAHIHLEQGIGHFKGAYPIYKSGDTFTFNGKVYPQYYPNVDGQENQVTDIFFIRAGLEHAYNDSAKARAYQWVELTDDQPEPTQDKDIIVTTVPVEDGYEYRLSVDGNKYGTEADKTLWNCFGDHALEADGWEEVVKSNGSIFYTYESATFAEGVEKSRGVNNQDLAMSCVTKFANTMAIGLDYSGGIVFDMQKNIVSKLASYYGAVTGMFGIMKDGQRCEWGRELESQRNNMYSNKSGRTIIGWNANTKEYIWITISGETGSAGRSGAELYDIAQQAGCTDAICMDGGGSVFLVRNGQSVVTTQRAVKNAVILYRRKKQVTPVTPTPDPTPTPTPDPTPVTPAATDDKDKQIADLQAQLKSMTSQADELVAKVEELKKQNADLTAANAALKTNIAQIKQICEGVI